MLSHRPTTAGERIHTSTNWIPYLYCLEDALLSWYQPWEARATGSLRVCNVLSIRDVTAERLFAELDTDGSGELDADELREAFNHLGLSLSERAMENVMMVFPHLPRLVV